MLKKDPTQRFGKFLLLEELNEEFSYFKPLNWDIVRNRRLLIPAMPEWGDQEVVNASEKEIKEEEMTIKGYHFKGFSFYNDCYDFEDDLSNI